MHCFYYNLIAIYSTVQTLRVLGQREVLNNQTNFFIFRVQKGLIRSTSLISQNLHWQI